MDLHVYTGLHTVKKIELIHKKPKELIHVLYYVSISIFRIVYSAACHFCDYLHMDVEAYPHGSSFEVPLAPSEALGHSHLVLEVPTINNLLLELKVLLNAT